MPVRPSTSTSVSHSERSRLPVLHEDPAPKTTCHENASCRGAPPSADGTGLRGHRPRGDAASAETQRHGLDRERHAQTSTPPGPQPPDTNTARLDLPPSWKPYRRPTALASITNPAERSTMPTVRPPATRRNHRPPPARSTAHPQATRPC